MKHLLKRSLLKRSLLKRPSLLAAGAVAAMLLGGTAANAQTLLENFTSNVVGGSGTAPAGTTVDQFIPPDTMGAVGTNDYIQLINGGYSVYSKAGTLENTNGATDSSFWAAAGISASVASSISDPTSCLTPAAAAGSPRKLRFRRPMPTSS